MRFLAAVAALVAAVVVAAQPAQGGGKVAKLETREHRQMETIRRSRQTLHFFANHPWLLVQASTRQTARRVIRFNRAQIRWTIRELAETRHALMAQRIPHRAQWLCIHGYEGSWDDPNAPYYGGLQMDIGFQRTYGGWLLRAKGTADHWTPDEQMLVAENAYRTRGFWPWPNTARYCGLL